MQLSLLRAGEGASGMRSRGMTGEHLVLMDSRGRISFPAAFRTAIGETLYLSPDLDRLGCLVVRSEDGFYEEYDELEAEAKKEGADKKKAHWALRQYTGRTETVTPDKNGRITIPAKLIDYAHLEEDKDSKTRKVLVIGVGPYAEIWDEETYRAAEAAYNAGFDDEE